MNNLENLVPLESVLLAPVLLYRSQYWQVQYSVLLLGKLLGGKQTSKMTAHLEALEELLTEEEYRGRVNNLSDIR